MEASTDMVKGRAEPIIVKCRTQLEKHGHVVDKSGCFKMDRVCGSVHTDLGPPNQDKTVNQDYVLAWHAFGPAHGLPCLAIAIADGVTTSYASEWGAQLACYAGLAFLDAAASASTREPKELARCAFREVCR